MPRRSWKLSRAGRLQKPETSLHIAVAEYLAMAMPHDSHWHHVPNGGTRDIREARELKRCGVKAGMPDIDILYRAYSYYIELKSLDGSLSKAQREMHAELMRAGARAIAVCRTTDQVEATLVSWDIPLRARMLNLTGSAA